VQSLHNVHVLRLLVADREAQLRPSLLAGTEIPWRRVRRVRRVRRWVGHRIVSLGAWIAADRTAQPAWSR